MQQLPSGIRQSKGALRLNGNQSIFRKGDGNAVLLSPDPIVDASPGAYKSLHQSISTAVSSPAAPNATGATGAIID
jgi:hypothetical protein